MENEIYISKALKSDVPEIVRLFADDILGSKREEFSEDIASSYYDAFAKINADNNQMLVVAKLDGKIIGTLQISFIYNLSFKGAMRALVEGVHVDKDLRSRGIGKYIMEWAIAEATKKGCRFVQLTSNKMRKDAHRFYESLGFTPSHEGFKLDLNS